MTMKPLVCAATLLASLLCGHAASAQQPDPITRTLLQKLDYPGDKMQTLLMQIDIKPNGLVPKHFHPGGEVGYIVEGSIEFTIADQPPRNYKPGETYLIPISTPHVAKAGPNGVKMIGTFVVEKDKPLATPVN